MELGGGGDNNPRPRPRPHIAVLPTPGMGHLYPLAELAKLLVQRHHFTVTFITFAAADNLATQSFLSSLPSGITSVPLPPVPLSDLPPDAAIETRMSVAALRSLPALRSLLLSLLSSSPPVALLADFFAASAADLAADLHLPFFLFIPTNLQFLSLMLHLPSLHASVPTPFHLLPHPLLLPACLPLPPSQLLTPLLDRSSDAYRWMLRLAPLYRRPHAILVNSFPAIEPQTSLFLSHPDPTRPPIFPVGPLVQTSAPAARSSAPCIAWLDAQPAGSVLFVSFGSGGTLTGRQLAELAGGLEDSGQRFLLVARSPCEDDASSAYFTAQTKENPVGYLPAGFLDRTNGIGLVVASWAPQMEVLAHAATGGFLSHCGWNSTLESVMHGVPMIAWPLFAEQRMNAVMLVEGVGIAIRPEEGEGGVVGRGEVARVVRELMEGEGGKGVRGRVRELKEAAKAALAEGGASYQCLEEVVSMWKKGVADV